MMAAYALESLGFLDPPSPGALRDAEAGAAPHRAGPERGAAGGRAGDTSGARASQFSAEALAHGWAGALAGTEPEAGAAGGGEGAAAPLDAPEWYADCADEYADVKDGLLSTAEPAPPWGGAEAVGGGSGGGAAPAQPQSHHTEWYADGAGDGPSSMAEPAPPWAGPEAAEGGGRGGTRTAPLLPRSARGPVEAAVTAAKFYCTVNARPVVESMVDDILRFVTPGSPLAEKALEVFFVERLVQTAGREMAAGALCPFKVRTGGPWYWGSRVWTHVSTIPCFFFGGFSKTEVEMPAGALCPFKVRAGGPWY